MPVSLWLIPPQKHPFTKSCNDLIIETIPSNFPAKLGKRPFMPHVTVTSDVDPAKTYEAAGQSPQEWLDGLTFPEFKKELDEVVIELDHVSAGEPFYRKLVIEVAKDPNLLKLAAACRRQAVEKPSHEGQNGDAGEDVAEKWSKSEYAPHMSLFYGDVPKKDAENKITLVEMQLGFEFGSLFACCGGAFCGAGSIVLVPTDKPLEEWKPIASRELPWLLWKMNKHLI